MAASLFQGSVIHSAKVQNFPAEDDVDSFMMLQVSGSLYSLYLCHSELVNRVVGRHYNEKLEILM